MRILVIVFSMFITAVVTPVKAQYISDIAPVDVYGNFENKGFSIEKDLGSNLGNFWTCTLNSSGINYTVEISSNDVNKVQSIRATAMNSNRNPGEVKQFLKYVSLVLFLDDTSGKAGLERWIDNNFNTKEAISSVGSTEIKISAPSKIVRKIRIDSDLSDGM